MYAPMQFAEAEQATAPEPDVMWLEYQLGIESQSDKYANGCNGKSRKHEEQVDNVSREMQNREWIKINARDQKHCTES